MKKLMIVATLALVAGFAKAASVDWAVTGGTSDQVGYSVYLVTAISDSWTGASDIAAAAAALGTGTSGTIAKAGRNYAIATTTASGESITASSMKSAYFVLVTDPAADSYKYISADLSGYVYGDIDTPPGTSNTTTAALLAGTTGSYATPGPGPGPEPVPEPTSGLLMLLGVAGLALRRRA